MKLATIITTAAFALFSSGMAFAEYGFPPNMPYGSPSFPSDAENGRTKARTNCDAHILKQNANGQTGAETGNENDPKQWGTGVTECDQFWKASGSIGNPD